MPLLWWCPPTRARRDLDNLFKAPLDSLTSAGFIADDGLFDDVRMVRGEVVKGGRLDVLITEMEEV
ncbi:MAG: RusA family crossover junction endodeoxyribonuclease [Erwinia billingiae]